jgi:FkbM family methyltransferase
MKTIIDKKFQEIINYFLKKNKNKIYKIFYFLFKNFIKGPFILNFEDYKFFSYPQKKNLSRWMLKNLRPWDSDTINLINNLLGNYKSLFVDCGVNYGAYSIPISKKKNTTVISFDPSRRALSELKNNIKLNNSKNIKYYNYGISDSVSKSFFSDNIDNFKNSGEYSFARLQTSYKVDTTTLDFFFKRLNLNIYKIIIIKLDIEGYEFNALLGMKKILLNNNVIIFFEFSRMLINKKNFSFKKFKIFVDQCNLTILDLSLNKINIKDILHKFSKLEKKRNTIGDYILVNKSSINFKSLEAMYTIKGIKASNPFLFSK